MVQILNESNFKGETKDGLVLVDFFAEWCGPCRLLAPVLDKIQGAKVVKVNTDLCQELAVSFKISALPTLVLLKDGEEVDRMVGLQTESNIQAKVKAHG